MNLIQKVGVDTQGLIQRYGGIDECRKIVKNAPVDAECFSWGVGDSGFRDKTVYLDDLRTAIDAHGCDHDWDDISKTGVAERTLICTYCSSIKQEQLQSELNNCSTKDSSGINIASCCTDNLSHFTDTCTDIRNNISPTTVVSEFNGLTNNDLESIGFKPLSHFTIGDSMRLDLGRSRYLSANCVGQGNEMVFICEKSKVGNYPTDLICVHNRDYDGFITLGKLKELIDWFGGRNDE